MAALASLSAQGTAPPRPALAISQIPLAGTVWPADFNRDSKADVVGWHPGLGALAIALGNGNGTFSTPVAIAAPGDSVAAVADFNADGFVDLLVDGSIVPARGNGTFGPAVATGVAIGEPEALGPQAAIADFDADGHRDIVTVGYDQLFVHPGNGDFSFDPPIELPTAGMPLQITAADLNGDGRTDVAASVYVGSTVDIFLNGGGLSFAPSSIPLAQMPSGITAWDLDSDGDRELIVGTGNVFFAGGGCCADQGGPGSIYVLRGNGNGTFQAPLEFAAGNDPMFVVAGDFNRDGIADIATGNYSEHYDGRCDGNAGLPDSIWVLPGIGNGTLGTGVGFSSGPFEWVAPGQMRLSSLKTADFDNDGQRDLVASGNIALNRASGANRPPIANAGPDGNIPSGSGPGTSLRGSGSDPDQHWLRFTWTDESGTVLGNELNTCFNYEEYSGSETFTLTVDDGVGGVATDTVTYSFGSAGADVGAVDAAGSSTENEDGSLTLRGSGADVWGTADEFFYRAYPVDGNFDIQTYVRSIENVNPWTKAGLMVRESYDPGSRHAFVLATPSTAKGVAFQRRPTTNGATVHTGGPAMAPAMWLRLTRTGNVIRAYSARGDNDAWTLIGEQTFTALPPTLLLGHAVSSHVDGTLAAATFDRTTFAWPQLQSADIGAVGLPGATTLGPASIRIDGGGADIWGTADAFRYHYTRVSGDADISVQVDSVEATHEWAKAGVMFRETLTPGSKQVMAVLSAARGVSMQYRSSTGGGSAQAANAPAVRGPVILRLIRIGDQFTAYWYQGPSGANALATVTIPMAAEIYVGLPVTSHNNSTLATAVFRDLFVYP